MTRAVASRPGVVIDQRASTAAMGEGVLVWLAVAMVVWLIAVIVSFRLAERAEKRRGTLAGC